MVGSIYFIEMPYSDFRQTKGRLVLVVKQIDKNDLLVLPLTSNLRREGIGITNKDIADGTLKKDSVVIVPKMTAVDHSLIVSSRKIATLKKSAFDNVMQALCDRLGC